MQHIIAPLPQVGPVVCLSTQSACHLMRPPKPNRHAVRAWYMYLSNAKYATLSMIIYPLSENPIYHPRSTPCPSRNPNPGQVYIVLSPSVSLHAVAQPKSFTAPIMCHHLLGVSVGGVVRPPAIKDI